MRVQVSRGTTVLLPPYLRHLPVRTRIVFCQQRKRLSTLTRAVMRVALFGRNISARRGSSPEEFSRSLENHLCFFSTMVVFFDNSSHGIVHRVALSGFSRSRFDLLNSIELIKREVSEIIRCTSIVACILAISTRTDKPMGNTPHSSAISNSCDSVRLVTGSSCLCRPGPALRAMRPSHLWGLGPI